MIRFVVLLACLGAGLVGTPGPSEAQPNAGAAVLQIPTSVRSEGMGLAYAPLERGAAAAWANPGALGLVRGLDIAAMNTRLVPDLTEDVLFENQSMVFGLGINFGDVPVVVNAGYQHTYLDYGTALDPGGPSSDINSYERSKGGTLAVGIADLVGFGMGIKRVEGDFDISFFGEPLPTFAATAYDFGLIARTPQFPVPQKGSPAPAWGASLVGGIAWQNLGTGIEFGTTTDALPRTRRESLALELNFLPGESLFPTSNRWLSALVGNVSLVSVIGTLGRSKDQVPYDIPDSIAAGLPSDVVEGVTDYLGAEVRFLGSLAVRYGHIDDERGQVIGNTFGWGLSFLGFAGVDYARTPQFHELENVVKWSFWLKIPFDLRI